MDMCISKWVNGQKGERMDGKLDGGMDGLDSWI